MDGESIFFEGTYNGDDITAQVECEETSIEKNIGLEGRASFKKKIWIESEEYGWSVELPLPRELTTIINVGVIDHMDDDTLENAVDARIKDIQNWLNTQGPSIPAALAKQGKKQEKEERRRKSAEGRLDEMLSTPIHIGDMANVTLDNDPADKVTAGGSYEVMVPYTWGSITEVLVIGVNWWTSYDKRSPSIYLEGAAYVRTDEGNSIYEPHSSERVWVDAIGDPKGTAKQAQRIINQAYKLLKTQIRDPKILTELWEALIEEKVV
jgi:hypothetical protein